MMNAKEFSSFIEAHPWMVYDEVNNERMGFFATLLGAARTVVQRPGCSQCVVYGPAGQTVGPKGCAALVHQWDFEHGDEGSMSGERCKHGVPIGSVWNCLQCRWDETRAEAAYWKAKFEQEERLHNGPKLTSTFMDEGGRMNEDYPKTWTWDEYVDSERGRLDYALDEIKHLKEQIARLKAGCAWAYQLAGAVGADVRALDNLTALANGKVPPHEWPYPAIGGEACR